MVTNEDLESIIDNEGIGYAVQNYYNGEDVVFENKTVQSLWIEAGLSLDELDKINDIQDKGPIVTTVVRFDDDDYIMVIKSNIPKELIENIECLYEDEGFDLNMKFSQLAEDNGFFFEELEKEIVTI